MPQARLFGLSDHLKRLSAHGDPLEELERTIDFEAFRPVLVASLAYADGAKRRPPALCLVAMLKVPVLAAQNNVADAERFDGRMLRDVVTNDNNASDVWADTAYRSRANEAWLQQQCRVSRIHRKKPRGKPMLERTARADAARSTRWGRSSGLLASSAPKPDHPRQPRLQYAPPDLPRTRGSDGITAPETYERHPKPVTWGTKQRVDGGAQMETVLNIN